MSKLPKEVLLFEVNQYLDGDEIMNHLRSTGMSNDDIRTLIELRKARALNQILSLLLELRDLAAKP